jgi:hypothetical protein
VICYWPFKILISIHTDDGAFELRVRKGSYPKAVRR